MVTETLRSMGWKAVGYRFIGVVMLSVKSLATRLKAVSGLLVGPSRFRNINFTTTFVIEW